MFKDKKYNNNRHRYLINTSLLYSKVFPGVSTFICLIANYSGIQIHIFAINEFAIELCLI